MQQIPEITQWDIIYGKLFASHPKQLLEVLRLQKIYGNIFLSAKLINANIYTACGAAEIEHVHLDEKNYVKRYKVNRLFNSLIGEGILRNSGDKYTDRRKNILPVFKVAKLQDYLKTMQQSTDEFILKIKQDVSAQKNKAVINIEKYSTLICLDIAGKVLFNQTWGDNLEQVGEIVRFLNEKYVASIFDFKAQYQIAKRLSLLKQIIYTRFIKSYPDPENNNINYNNTDNLLSCLLNYKGHDKYNYKDQNEIFDEIITMLLTGHETSAMSVVFSLALLSIDKDYKELVLSEIDKFCSDELTYSDLQNCVYTKMWLEETMRMYPPVWATVRYSLDHDEINGYYLPANSYVLSNIYALHRNPEYWQQPKVFNPFRFSKENKAKQVKGSYIPFATGPRICAASNFAMLELQVIVTRLLQQLKFEKIPGMKLELAPYLTLKTDPSLSMYVTAR